MEGAVGYEVYIRSFADSTGDGIGDLRGVTGRLDYLKWLGIDLVWITPFFASPGHDHGYDVSNYCAVNPIHGTLADADELIERAHQLGLRVIFDIVPNHTSSEHRWFKTAIEDTSSPERDYYLFRDPAPGGGPPNNWPSHFGPSAWTLDAVSGQYYCHLFLPEQPDLNWRNPAVRAEFDAIYRFWLDRGVDGFRLDVAHGLLKHPDFPDLPLKRQPRPEAGPLEVFFSFDHVYDLDQDGNGEIFRRWKDVAGPYGAALVAESGVDDHQRLTRYSGPSALDLAFFLKPGWMSWQPELLLQELLGAATSLPADIAWAISNHDQSRPVTRWGGGEQGQARSLAVTTLMFVLGGVPFLYQGEELALEDGMVGNADRRDPIATRNETTEGRDVSRTPMPWNSDSQNGFTSGQPWIRSPHRPHRDTVAGQHGDDSSPLHRYRELVTVRHRFGDLSAADMKIVPSGQADVAIVQRGATLTVANLGQEAFAVNLGDHAWTVVFASKGASGHQARGLVNVSAETTVIFVVG